MYRSLLRWTLPLSALALAAQPSLAGANAVGLPRSALRIATVELAGGMIRGEVLDAGEVVGRFVARHGTTVRLAEATAPDGTRVLTGIGLRPPAASSHAEALHWASEFGAGLGAVRAFAADRGIPFAAPVQPAEQTQDECEAIQMVVALLPNRPRGAIWCPPDVLGGGPVGSGSSEGSGSYGDPNPMHEPPTLATTLAPLGLTPEGSDEEQPPGYVWDSGCADIDNGKIHWHGCYTRWTVEDRDPDYWYSGDESQATGNATSRWYGLKKGVTEHAYGRGTVVKWNPGVTQPGSAPCETVTLSLGMFGTTLRSSLQACRDKIDPYVQDDLFKATWSGETDSDAVQAVAQNFVKIANSTGSGDLVYWIRATWAWG